MNKSFSVLGMLVVLVVVAVPFISAQPVDIEFWEGGAVSESGPPPADWAAYKILRDKLNINLKLVLEPSTPTDQSTKINTSAASNRLPDFFMVGRDTWLKLVEKGLIASTDDIWKKIPNRVKKYYSDPEETQLITYKGKKYGFADPGSNVKPAVEGLVIRKDWLDKLKLKVPTTTEELFQVAKAFTDNDPDGNGKADTYGFGAFIETNSLLDVGLGRRFIPILAAYGVPTSWDASSAKTFGLSFKKPEYLSALQYVKRLVDAKAIHPDWATLKKDDFRLAWKQGKFGIMFEQFSALHSKATYDQFDNNFPNGVWEPIPAIKGPKGVGYSSVTIKAIRIHAISKRAAADPKKIDAIARFLEWTASDEGYFLLGFGTKGVNYNLDAQGNITYAGLDPKNIASASAMAPLTQIRNLVYVNDDRELFVRYPDYKSKAGRTISPLGTLKFFNTQPIYNATAASFINAPNNAADIQRYIGENIVKFVLGQQPLDQAGYANFIKGLDALGAAQWEKNAKDQLIAIGQLR